MVYLRRVRRALALLLLIAILAPGTWWRMRPPPHLGDDVAEIGFVALKIPRPQSLAADLGPFRLEKAWRLTSRNRGFGGYSALLPLGGGQLLAVSDQGKTLRFSPPGAPPRKPVIRHVFDWKVRGRTGMDIESVTADRASATVWTGLEFRNSIVRYKLQAGGALQMNAEVAPRNMSDWGDNSGPEALVRLRDGRFLVLREGFSDMLGRSRHAALMFPSDPIEAGDGTPFSLAGIPGFKPTDMAELPDGRVLILFRRLDWPLPERFSIRLAIGDPRSIEPDKPWHVAEIARLPESLPVDNFEGLALEPTGEGDRLTVWLISDDNRAVFQATYLWKLSLDPADLPKPRKKARGSTARPSQKPD